MDKSLFQLKMPLSRSAILEKFDAIVPFFSKKKRVL
jgi:hypothetical protein